MNYLYKITNLLNNRIYIGVHKTDDLNDGYMGSGKLINSAIKKYGIENFKKEILEFFDTYADALAREADIVTDEFLLREDVYNLRKGGQGGFDYINHKELNNAANNGYIGGITTRDNRRNDPTLLAAFKLYSSNRLKQLHQSGNVTYDNFSGKLHSVESKNKMSLTKKGTQMSTANSQFGTMWITNGIDNKKIKNTEPIPQGWVKGRNLRY